MNSPRIPSVVARLATALVTLLLAAAVVASPAAASPAAPTPAAPIVANTLGGPAPAQALPANHAALTYIHEVLTWLGTDSAAVALAATATVEPVTAPVSAAPALEAIDQTLRWLDYQYGDEEPATIESAPAPDPAVEPALPAEATVEPVANTEPVEADALRAIDHFLTKLDPAVQAAIPKGYVDLGHGVYGPEHLLRIRRCESTDQYDVASSSGKFRGAYQFSQQTWDWRAELNGRLDLVGAEITAVSPADQDQMAVWNYEQRNPYNEWPVCSHR